jgi:hypothetical protein
MFVRISQETRLRYEPIRFMLPISLSVPHIKHITSPLQAQQVNALYRFVTLVY